MADIREENNVFGGVEFNNENGNNGQEQASNGKNLPPERILVLLHQFFGSGNRRATKGDCGLDKIRTSSVKITLIIRDS